MSYRPAPRRAAIGAAFGFAGSALASVLAALALPLGGALLFWSVPGATLLCAGLGLATPRLRPVGSVLAGALLALANGPVTALFMTCALYFVEGSDYQNAMWVMKLGYQEIGWFILALGAGLGALIERLCRAPG